tara:strand:- start:556 stop:696 length:141 start_codon:yes stop_codon:yes gene_type:complete
MNKEEFKKELEEQKKLELQTTGHSSLTTQYDDATYEPVDIDYTTQS